MLASVRWINRYLSPADLTADEAVAVLERTSFPIESREDLPPADTRLDVELTSNRGDAFSHIALAREIALATGRSLILPDVPVLPAPSPLPASLASVSVHTPQACPRFTACVIEGVKVGPSPAWLREALEAVGQRSINNIVDVTNFVLLETGHPSHAFDLDRLAGHQLNIRWAKAGEAFTALDGKQHKLQPDELVVADAERAQSLAGVIGGQESGVTESTTRVLLEVATWDPVVIRRAARRLQIFTDAAYRFERVVDPRDIPAAAARLLQLILEVAGGKLAPGSVDLHAELPARATINLRPARCNQVLGLEVPPATMKHLLEGMGFTVEPTADGLACTVPHNRTHDITREIDLIEEVGRLFGIDHVPVAATLPVRFDFKHPKSWEARERSATLIASALTAQGYYETVTFSFASESTANQFMPAHLRPIKVDEQRRREMPYLRPSIIPSLLKVRRDNQDGKVTRIGGIRLYEIASTFAERNDAAAPTARQTVETRQLALLIDVDGYAGKAAKKAEALQLAFRAMRGTIEQIVSAVGGSIHAVTLKPIDPPVAAYQSETVAAVLINNEPLGHIATITAALLREHELDTPLIAAELDLATLAGLYPPYTPVQKLPAYPPIERDLSVIVDNTLPWDAIAAHINNLSLENFERCDFVGTFRGEPIATGKKSVTLRITFRDASRTLRREEADDAMATAMNTLKERYNAEVRQ